MNPMMDEMAMMGEDKEHKGGKSARLMALEKLLDFIAQSEAKRATPPVEAPMEAPSEELGDDVLSGLAGLKDDEDGV